MANFFFWPEVMANFISHIITCHVNMSFSHLSKVLVTNEQFFSTKLTCKNEKYKVIISEVLEKVCRNNIG